MLSSPVQLSLNVSLRDDATFDNFYPAPDNRIATLALKDFSVESQESSLVLWGGPGAGLTHLAKACCQSVCQLGGVARFIALAEVVEKPPEPVLAETAEADLVCLDDLQLIAGRADWEEAVFHLFNRVKDRGHRLLMTSHTSPASLPIKLADLRSRVLGSLVYQLQSLSDDDKARMLQRRALARGIELSDEVVRFILSRAPRNTERLFAVLDQLDAASLQQQRKLTIPFVKQVLRL